MVCHVAIYLEQWIMRMNVVIVNTKPMNLKELILEHLKDLTPGERQDIVDAIESFSDERAYIPIVKQLVLNGRKLAACKYIKENTGRNLREAKDELDHIMNEMRDKNQMQ